MNTYTVTYTGNNSKFNSFSQTVNANSSRQAVEDVYSSVMDSNYFPQEDGSICDCDGHEIANAGDDCIEYDGGYFCADIHTFDIVFNDSENSDSKGFKQTYEYCKDYIDTHNGSDHSYFADYKGGTVSIVNNYTMETEFETAVI